MPKYRQLHMKLLDSVDFADMPDDFTRVFWMCLILIVDSAGRGFDNRAWIRSKMFPLRDDVTLEQIDAAMNWLSKRQMITRYAGERKYFEITNWNNYQTGTDKEAKSSIPSPEQVRSKSGVSPDKLPPNTTDSTNTINNQLTTDSTDSTDEKKQTPPPLPNAYKIYESNIGALTPVIADMIDVWIRDKHEDWVIEAIEEAAKHNARNWAYIDAILKAKLTGKNNGKPAPKKKIVRRLNGPKQDVIIYDDGSEEYVPHEATP